MILKGLKEKAAHKYLKKQLAAEHQEVRKGRTGIHSLGCLVDLDLLEDTGVFYDLAERLSLKANEIKIIGYKTKVEKTSPFSIPVFSAQDLGWKGEIKNGYAIEFLNYEFDLLINYFKEDKLPMLLMSSKVKSRLKVGFSGEAEMVSDLLFSNDLKDFKAFESELIKYLKILKEVA